MNIQGNRIKQLRKALGLNQQEFAERIGLNNTSISLFENGTREISKRTRLAIIRAFHVNPVWLDTGEGDMFLPFSESDEIIRFARDVTKAEDGDIRLEIMKMLARMSPAQWQEAWELWCKAKNLIHGIKKDDSK